MSDDKNDDKYKMRKNGWLALAVLLFLCSFSALRYWVMDFNFFAFLIGGVFVYFAYLSLKKSGVFDTSSDDKKWKGPKRANRSEGAIPLTTDQIPREQGLPPVSLASPDFDLEGFPFVNKAYVMHKHDHVDEDTGGIIATREYYYADNEAVIETVKAIASLEFLIDRIQEHVSTLPQLRSEVDKLTPLARVVEESELPMNSVCLTIKKPTPSGEIPKYPVEIHFHTFDSSSENGSYGTLGYLETGQLAIAAEDFIVDEEHFHIQYKIVDKEMAISKIERRGKSDEAPAILFEQSNSVLP